MKKIYMLGLALLSTAALNAQDTLTAHFAGTPTVYGATGGGTVAGNNDYGDLAKMQLFDNSYGVTVGYGSISNVLLWVAAKSDLGGGSFQVKLYADNSGAPGTVIGSTTITCASVDTSVTGFSLIGGGAGAYNVNASFSSPVAIPAGGKFWAGVVLPTTATDSIHLATTTDGDFTDAVTHAGEFWSDGSFHTFGDATNWDLDIALGVFPVVKLSLATIDESDLSVAVYPNPTNGVLNFNFGNGSVESILIKDLSGREVAKIMANGDSQVTYDVSYLADGTYVIEALNENGNVAAISKFVKK